jgi:hypothetical protein
MSDTFSKVEVITGAAYRRRFWTDLKPAVVCRDDAARYVQSATLPPLWALARRGVPPKTGDG